MRRSALILYVMACLSLLAVPFRDVHAHVDVDHDQILVHGGHDHEFDHHETQDLETHHGHDEQHDVGHLAVHHDSHEGRAHSHRDGHEREDVTNISLIEAPHHVHVVSVASAEFDIGSKRWSPSISTTIFRFEDPPDRPISRLEYPPIQDRIFPPRSHLHPPLRGPPLTFR
jgi:hypothetical protein